VNWFCADGGLLQGQRLQQIYANLYDVPTPSASEDVPQCVEVNGAVDAVTFMRDYVLRSQPVIFRGAVAHWPALARWTNEFLRYASLAGAL